MPGQLMNMGNWFFFLSLSNFWIIFLHIISIWINEWFARIYLIEESKVTLVAPGNYEIKFKSAHITAPSSSSRIVFSVFSHLRESWGTAQGEERLLDTEESSSPLTLSSLLFQRRPPFLSDAHSGQDHVAHGDTECIYTGSATASTMGMLNARKLWIAVSILFSSWASTVTPWWRGSPLKPFPDSSLPLPNGAPWMPLAPLWLWDIHFLDTGALRVIH